MKRLIGLVMMLVAAGLLAASCGGGFDEKKAPVYPACDSDQNCSEKGEFCVNKQCVECGKDKHCKGTCQGCKGNKCGPKENCCAGPQDCAQGQDCIVKPGKKEGTCGAR